MNFVLILWLIVYMIIGLVSVYFVLTVPKEKKPGDFGLLLRIAYWHGHFFAVVFAVTALITLVVGLYEFIRFNP